MLDVDVASASSHKVQLTSISFTNVSGGFVTRQRPAGMLRYREDRTGIELQCTETGLDVFLTYNAGIEICEVTDEALHDGEDERGVVLATLTIETHSKYRFRDEPLDEQQAYHFAGLVGFMHAYPYIRTEVQSLTTKLGLPPLTLQVVLSGEVADRVEVTVLPGLEATVEQSPKRTKATKKARKLQHRPSLRIDVGNRQGHGKK